MGRSILNKGFLDPNTIRRLKVDARRAVARREIAEHQKSPIEEFPRIANPLTVLWGCDEVVEFLERFIVVERSRESRAGFPPECLEDLVWLFNLATAQREILRRQPQTRSQRLASERKRRKNILDLSWNLIR